MKNVPLIEAKGLRKYFAGVRAIHDVDFDVMPGEVHAIIGENGAGKSTLIKILAGVHQADSGSMLVKGKPVSFRSPGDAQQYRIALICQELTLVPFFNVVENMFLGRELTLPRSPRLDHRRMRQRATSLLETLGVDLDLQWPIKRLGTAQQQMAAIAGALLNDASVIIMDEPTARLSSRETSSLFETIRRLKRSGVGIVYISHRLEEIFEIADRVTVLRDGEGIGTVQTRDATVDTLIQMMVGRTVHDQYPKATVPVGDVVLEVKNLSRGRLVQNVNFEVRRGEILGVSGLVGSGRTELLRLVFGADHRDAGDIIIDGNLCDISSPRDAVRLGIALVPEDRQGQGLVMGMNVRENSTLAQLAMACRAGFIMRNDENRIARQIARRLEVKARSIEQRVRSLSGGNQQKVVLSKWLVGNPRIVLLDEPTRGIDVAAKAEIFELIGKMAQSGTAIVLVSSELPEILAISDKVLVMHQGRQAAVLGEGEITAERIMYYATGGVKHETNPYSA